MLLRGLPQRLRLGTRRSLLARTQSQWVADRLVAALEEAVPERRFEVQLVEVTTRGDVSKASLASFGGTGVFVSALRDALLENRIDFAVHSLKDLPTASYNGLILAALPPREDPRDALVARQAHSIAQLPPGSRVGTGSPRRAAQLRALGLDLDVVDVRGNVDTRIGKVTDGELEAVVLARAGLLRLGRENEITEAFDPLLMLPAPGQGALGVETQLENLPLVTALRLLDDPVTRASVLAERSLLARLEAGCAAPVGALAEVVEGERGLELTLRAFAGSLDGAISLRRSASAALPGLAWHRGMAIRPGFHEVSGLDRLSGLDRRRFEELPAGGLTASRSRTEVPADLLAPPDRPAAHSYPGLLTANDEVAAIALGRALAEQMLDDGAARLIPVPTPPPADGTAAKAREGDS
jgi:hydroxymethylbilane synthase